MNGAASALTHLTNRRPIRTRNNHADAVKADQLDLDSLFVFFCVFFFEVFFPPCFVFFVARFYLLGEVEHSASQTEKVQYLKSFNGQSGVTRLKQKKNKAVEVDIGKRIWRQAKLA